MASFAAFTTATRMGRVVQWLFPSRRAVAAAAAFEVVGMLLALPLPVHVIMALALHLALAIISE